MTDFHQRFLLGFVAIILFFGAIGLSIHWGAPIEHGVATTSWPIAPAEILACQFRSEFDPEATSNSHYEVRNTSSRIAVAYAVETAAGPRYFETFHFDAFGTRLGNDGFMGGDVFEVRSVLHAGPDLEVRYNPADPAEAVVEPGIPFYTSCLFVLPCTLFALAMGLTRLAFRPGTAKQDQSAKQDKSAEATILGAILLPFAAVTLILFLRPTFSLLSNRLPPWWILPGFYIVTLLMLASPGPLRRIKPVQTMAGFIMLGMLFFIPAVGLTGLAVTAVTGPHDRGFGFELSDAECVARLDAENPVVAEWACWEIVRRKGPRSSIPALRRLLVNPEIDTRKAAVSALRQMGVAAMVAMDDLTLAARQGDNQPILDDLNSLIGRLRSYQDMQEKVTLKRKLLQSPDATERQAAAFWLGHLGELAAPALPDLEALLADPASEDIKLNVEAAINRIRRATHGS